MLLSFDDMQKIIEWLKKPAKKTGKGNIMYVAPMPDGIGSSVSFGSQ